MTTNDAFPTPTTYLGPRPDTHHVRTGPPPAPAGDIHPCDPAAVARLHALLGTAQRRAAKANRTGRAAYDHGNLIVNHQRRVEQLAAGRAKRPTDDQINAAVAAHQTGRPWATIASDLGLAETTLVKYVRLAGHPTARPPRRETNP